MTEDADRKIAVLLHGIGHSRYNLMGLEKSLRKENYAVLNLSYPSRRYNISAISDWLSHRLAAENVWRRFAAVHFVGHSMGGLVIQDYLETIRNTDMTTLLGRVVMLGTPHGGSEVADFLHKTWMYKFAFGPAGQELTTKVRRQEKERIRPYYELGLIAGTRSWLYPLGRMVLKGKHDGCVSVESVQRGGASDYIELPVLHGLMGWDSRTISHTISFLGKGAF